MKKRILYSIDEYDKDGDRSEEGIYLHFGDTKIKIADRPENTPGVIADLEQLINQLHGEYINRVLNPFE
jgi:hypothetical protein